LGFEGLLLSFASPDRQVRVFGSIVCAHPGRPMAFGQSELAHRGAIRGKPVGEDRLVADLNPALSVKRKQSPTAWRITAGGKRWRL
jgi:hypothetical protein